MLRKAIDRDANAIAQLIIAAIGEHLTELYTGYANPQYASTVLIHFIQQKGNRFSKELIVVDEQDGVITGMILCYDGRQARSIYEPIEHRRSQQLGYTVRHPIEASDNEYYIDAIAVSPNYQGQGIASKLMAQAELDSIALGINQIGLLVDVDKEHAKQVYVSKGYEQVGIKELDGEPFYHMVKRLA